MALAKVKNRETILKGIIGLLIATNILSFGQYIVKCNELSDERIAHQKTIEKAKKDLQMILDETKELEEQASIKINSESDIRIIRKDLIKKIEEVVQDRNFKIDEVDILRALNSTENRIMDEYIRVAALVLATMETETGFKHMVHENANGTKDYGIMQVNEVVVSHLKEALGEHIDPINNKNHNVEGGSWEIYECYLKAKDKHPEDVIWWTYAYYNRGMYFENTEAWKNKNHPSHEKVHKQADIRSNKFKECYNAYYEALNS